MRYSVCHPSQSLLAALAHVLGLRTILHGTLSVAIILLLQQTSGSHWSWYSTWKMPGQSLNTNSIHTLGDIMFSEGVGMNSGIAESCDSCIIIWMIIVDQISSDIISTAGDWPHHSHSVPTSSDSHTVKGACLCRYNIMYLYTSLSVVPTVPCIFSWAESSDGLSLATVHV